MGTRVTSTRFVGRAAQLADLEAAWQDAAAGRPSFAFIAGESGVGKSRLLQHAERHMEADGARVLVGDCVDLGEGELPYAPLVAALRPLLRSDDAALQRLDPDARAELAALAGSATGTSQGRLFEALLSLVEVLSAEGPLVLVIEDLHWADRSTRAFLTFLTRSVCSERLLVLASYRPDELHRRHPLRPLLAELERDPRARRVELLPLTQVELAEQLEDILGAAPDPELVARLWRRSEGNPLFTEELLAAGLDGHGGMPPTLRDALMVRIERLPPAAQDVARLLAAGQRLDHELLAAAGELDPRELREALREAVANHILVADADSFYAFRHALLREVVNDDLLPGERAHLHLALARALEARGGATPGAHLASAIAHHFHAAGDQRAALVAAIRAGDAAMRIHAQGEAGMLLQRGLELWSRVPDAEELLGFDEAALLLKAACALDTLVDGPRVIALLERALTLLPAGAPPERTARVLQRMAQAQWNLNAQEEALATAERALSLLPEDSPSATRAGLVGWQAKRLMLMGRYRRAVDVAGRAIADALAVGDPSAESLARNAAGYSRLALGDVEAGIAELSRAAAIARGDELLSELSSARINLADGLHLVGRTDEAIAAAEAGMAELGPSYPTSWMRLSVAEFTLDAGRVEEAALLLPGPEQRRTGGSEVMYHGLVRTRLHLHRGEHDAARELLAATSEHADTTMEPQYSGQHGAMVAELALREGALEAARAAAALALDRIVTCTDDASRVAEVAAVGVLVEAAAARRARDLGDADAAAGAVARAELLEAYVAGAAGRPVEDARVAECAAALARARGEDDPLR